MPSPNPNPQIQLSSDGSSWQTPGLKLSVSANATFYARLASTANVDSTTWQIISTDELGATATVGAGTGIAQSTTTGTAAGTGTALILQATVNGGIDKTTGNPNPLTTTARVKVWVPAANAYEVIVYDEHGESGAMWYVPLINRGIRNSSGGGTADVNPTPDTLGLRDGFGQLRATSFATASSGVAASGALQLPAGDQIAVAIKGQSNDTVALLSATNTGATLALGDGDEITEVDFLGAVAVDLSQAYFSSVAAAPLLGQSQLGGNGTTASKTLKVQAQKGQNVASGTNNDGGDLVLAGGDVGGGGTGGAQGDVVLQGANINFEGVLAEGGSASLGTATTGPGQQIALGSPISIPSNTAFTWKATFTGKIVGPTQVVLFHQEYLFQVGDYGSLAFNTTLGGIDTASAWKIASPTQPWSTTTGVANSLNVTAVADDGGGRCQLTVSTIGSVRQGSTVLVANVLSGCNGPRIVDSVSGNNIVLRGTTYATGYVSGGTVVVQACVTTGGATNPLQFYGNGLEPAKWTAGETVSAGDFRQTSGGDVYQYTHGGTVDASTAPSAHANSVADGTATCDFVGSSASTPSISWQLTELKQTQM